MPLKSLLICFCAMLLCCSALVSTMVGESKSKVQDDADAAKVNSRYDQKKDETEVEFRQLPLKGNDTQRIFLSVSASYKGQKPKRPEDVIFIVSVLSQQSYRYPDVLAMQVLIEGKKAGEVVMINLDKRRAEEDYLETIGTRMKYDLFQRLLKASSAELHLANLTLPLEAAHLAKLRELDAMLH